MPWNLLILPLIGGYFIISQSNRFRFTQQRLDRQRLIFDSSMAGLILLITSFLLREIVDGIFPGLISSIYECFPVKTPYLGTTICAFLFSLIFTYIGNQTIFRDNKYHVQAAIRRVGNELELLLLSSLQHTYLLEFTLENDKVYIGWVKELPIPSISTYIRIIPAFSGYRDEEKHLNFTTDYYQVYNEYIEQGVVKEIGEMNIDLIIPLEQLVTVSYFDNEMYEKFVDSSDNMGRDIAG